MARIITVEIDEVGDATVDIAGVKGKGCQAIQDVFGRALGTTVKVVTKAEYFQDTNKNLLTN